MKGLRYGEASDIYSFAIILWQIITHTKKIYGEYFDYFPLNDFKEFRRFICGNRPSLDNIKIQSISNLIQACWHKDPSERPSSIEIMNKLDHIMMEVAIKDKLGYHFWISNFQMNEFVEFDVLIDNFISYTEYSNIDQYCISCFKLLINKCEKQNDQVNVQDFGDFLQTFGPLTESNKGKIFQTVCVYLNF